MEAVTMRSARRLKQKVDRERRVVVHFWNPEVEGSWQDLKKLFAFSVKHRDIFFYFVAVDDGNRLSVHERMLSKQVAPFQSNRGVENVTFLVDEHAYLQQLIYPSKNRPPVAVSQTAYLQKETVVRYDVDAVGAAGLNPQLIWNKK